jgi:putative transposase
MADVTSVDLARRVGEDRETASPDLLRAMVQPFAEALMSADADAVCGAPYGQVSEDRVKRRNGYRERRWDTRAGAARRLTRERAILPSEATAATAAPDGGRRPGRV